MFYIQKMLVRARFNSKLINGFIKKATHITNRENVVYITAIMIVWMCLDAACVPTTLQHLYVARWIINIDKYFTWHKHCYGLVAYLYVQLTMHGVVPGSNPVGV